MTDERGEAKQEVANGQPVRERLLADAHSLHHAGTAQLQRARGLVEHPRLALTVALDAPHVCTRVPCGTFLIGRCILQRARLRRGDGLDELVQLRAELLAHRFLAQLPLALARERRAPPNDRLGRSSRRDGGRSLWEAAEDEV